MSTGRKYFRKEGVVVKHPDLGKTIVVKRLDMPSMASMPVMAGGFDPFRPVINLKVIDLAHPNLKVIKFNPPLEVHVRYDIDDEADAKKRVKPLRLGYWDGMMWQYFTPIPPPTGHDFKLKLKRYKKFVGWGKVKISVWKDPPKAWGT